MSNAVIILAAGQGTRMQSDLPKVLHPLGAAPLLAHALTAARALEPARMVVVAGHGGDQVRRMVEGFAPEAEVVLQEPQLGTGHAVVQALPALASFEGRVVVIYGDTPFLRAETLAAMVDAKADVVVLGFEATDPGRYGRLIIGPAGLERIVEFKDASADERAITLCNSGVIAADAAVLAPLIAGLGNTNAAGEYYLTDIVAAARAGGQSVAVVLCSEAETLGINTRAELAAAEALFQANARAEALENGVTLTAPETVFFALDTWIGRDALIGPNVVFGPGRHHRVGCRGACLLPPSKGAISRRVPQLAHSRACAPEPNLAVMCTWATLSSSRTQFWTRASRLAISPILAIRMWASAPTSAQAR